MTTQALGLPLDITWQRLGYSRDMIDTSFNLSSLPPKWRSSLSVYSYVVPEEQTLDSYPDSRIVYLKLTCSITGFNISEDLIDPRDVDSVGNELDDLQSSSWEAVQSEGWANKYWGCHGAIAQVAVYPSQEDDVGPDDFPFIQDFEPKKRELYEARTESGEYLSGTTHGVSVLKGTTSVEHTEKSVKASAGGVFGPIGASVEAGLVKSDETSNTNSTTTDASREKRESSSFSTSFSQMYQLFNGYHVGTNRAVFVISPRPHTVSGADGIDFNLVDGHRKLEGIQEMFLVVRVPKTLKGICVQANLDTGHTIETVLGQPLRVMYRDTYDPLDEEPGADDPGLPDFPPDGDDGEGDDTDGGRTYTFLVVTRRTVRNCGLFDDSHRITPVGAGPGITPGGIRDFDSVVYEQPIALGKNEVDLYNRAENPHLGKLAVANQRNRYQRLVRSAMLSGFTAAKYEARPVTETQTFATLARLAAKRRKIALDENLVRNQVLTLEDFKFLVTKEVARTDLLFDPGERVFSEAERERLIEIRRKIRDHIIGPVTQR